MILSRTFEAVVKQAAAMGAKAFEIGLFDPNAATCAMIPRAWDFETLLRAVFWLRLKNAEGRNIYIRAAGEHCLSLIDDASLQVVERLKSKDFLLRLWWKPLRETFKHGCTTAEFYRNIFQRLQQGCWPHALVAT